jgi:hypothetical protein
MMYDETESMIINQTKMIKNGTMDDVYIFEKVSVEDIRPILLI